MFRPLLASSNCRASSRAPSKEWPTVPRALTLSQDSTSLSRGLGALGSGTRILRRYTPLLRAEPPGASWLEASVKAARCLEEPILLQAPVKFSQCFTRLCLSLWAREFTPEDPGRTPLGDQKDGSPVFGSDSSPDLLITSRFVCPSGFDPSQPMSQLHPQLVSGQR